MAQMRTSNQLNSLWKLPLEWDILNGSNILVAGASGLIGSALVRALISNPQKGYKVYALGRNREKLQQIFKSINDDKKLILIEGDVNEYLTCDIDFHYIIDCASNANPSEFREHPVETIRTNINGAYNLLKYGMNHNLKRFLYVSTGEVYGETTSNESSEGEYGYVDNLNPRSCYPISKRTAENLCVAYAQEYEIDVVIARPCHIYGPGFLDSDDRAYAQFFRRACKREDIVLNSPGLLKRSWCYVVDCVSALLYILFRGNKGQAYNISDVSLTIRDFAILIAHAADVDIKFDIDNTLPSPIISQGILDSSKIQELGWSVQNSIEDNIKSCLLELNS